jgi:hypothetical protein
LAPGGEFGSIASDVEGIQVNEVQFHGAGNKAAEEQAVQGPFVGWEGGEIAIAFQGGRQGNVGAGSSQDPVDQSVNNVAVRAQIVLVPVLLGLVSLVSTLVGVASRSTGLTGTLQEAVLEAVEGTHPPGVSSGWKPLMSA